MEKFAVDLEKVLDEFEYNEEREENISAPSVKNSHMPHLGLTPLKQMPPVRPPAASYRRPSFEPINLAEADFAASPPKSSISNFSLENADTQNDNKEIFSFGNSRAQLKNRNYSDAVDSIVSTLNNEVNINKQIILESDGSSLSDIWQQATSSLQNDEKPDLLEYNSKNSHSDTNSQQISNQLPDVTSSIQNLSVHGVNNNSVESTSNSLDLISSANGTLLLDSNNINCSNDFVCEEKTSSVSEPENNLQTDDHQLHMDSNKLINTNSISDSEIIINESYPLLNENNTKSKENNSSSESQIDSNSNKPLDIITKLQINVPECENEPKPYDEPFQSQLKTQLEEETNQIDVKVGPQLDTPKEVSDYKAPIGFNNDVVLSDVELEEYLKELEVLDESLPYEDHVKEKSLSLLQDVQSCTNTNSASHPSVLTCNKEEISDPNLNNEDQCKSIDLSNDHCVSPATLSSLLNTFSTKENTSDSSLSSNIEHEKITHDTEQTNNVKESPICNSSSSSIQSLKTQTNNNNSLLKSHTNEKNKSDEKESSDVCQDHEVVSLNPFKSNSEFEIKSELQNNINKELKSKTLNPFSEYDLAQGTEQFEAKSKSTNPFEDDLDDSSTTDKENIAVDESFQPKTLELLNTGAIATNPDECDSFSAFSREPCRQDIKLATETVVCSESSASDLKHSADSTTENVADAVKINLLEENTSCEKNIETENLIIARSSSTECLPSCSGSYRESQVNTLNSVAKMIPIKKAVESPVVQNVDEAGVPAEEDRPPRPNSLELPKKITVESTSSSTQETVETEGDFGPEERRLGKVPPFWIPDTDAMTCMQCQLKFNVIKRRHHCRACGQVLCYKCCGLKAQLEYMNFAEARVCQPCFTILQAVSASESSSPQNRRQPNPNNPMEYCSTIPPLQQVAGAMHHPPPSVMVPVGVLKREGRSKSDVTKQVMFSDGIRPGGDLTELDGSGEPRIPFRRSGRLTKRVGTPPGGMMSSSLRRVLDPSTHSFIPPENEAALPPIISRVQGEINYTDLESPVCLNQPVIKFALNRNLLVSVKRVMLDCCVNRECWCFSSEGLSCVGQDEIVFLLECLPEETLPPKDVFLLINYLYQEAAKGSTVSELSFTPAISNNLLGSRDHGGFLYIRTSYQCTAQLPLPSPPYLVALLVNRWETPWARLFPIRLVLRLGAEFRYYPSPLVSVRNRPPLYTDIGHTIINILADFRKYSYTLPSVRGLVIHMEDRQTTINIPRNRYDQVVRALNNSNDSVLAFGANLSLVADSHLVCMQSTEDENTYHTQAINIHNKPRKVTGASFVVFNGALKVPGLAGKSNIVEDGLMVQVPSETMVALRTALRDMRDYTIGCGPHAEETVVLQWTADDTNFNIGVKSCIDGKPLDGVPSIRVHNGTDYSGGVRIIRWTEVFILQCEDSAEHSSEPVDISRLSESIARATCLALVPLLDLLSAAGLSTLAVRTTIHPDNVGYEAGSNGEKLPPLYMKSLDDELIAVVHQAALSSQDSPAMLELVFRVMEQG